MTEKDLRKVAGEMFKNWIENQKKIINGLSSQRKIEKELGISQSTLSYYINGKRYPHRKHREILYKTTMLKCYDSDWIEKNEFNSEKLESFVNTKEVEELEKSKIIEREEIKLNKCDALDFPVIFAGYLQNLIEENIKKALNVVLEKIIQKSDIIKIYKIKEEKEEVDNTIFDFLEHLDTRIFDIQNKISKIYSDLVGSSFEKPAQETEEKKENHKEFNSSLKLDFPELPQVEVSDTEIHNTRNKIIELSCILASYSNFPEGSEQRETARLALIEPVKQLFMAIFVFDKQFPSSLSDVIQQYRQIIFLNSKESKKIKERGGKNE